MEALTGEIIACATYKMKNILALYEKMYNNLSRLMKNGITNNNKEWTKEKRIVREK